MIPTHKFLAAFALFGGLALAPVAFADAPCEGSAGHEKLQGCRDSSSPQRPSPVQATPPIPPTRKAMPSTHERRRAAYDRYCTDGRENTWCDELAVELGIPRRPAGGSRDSHEHDPYCSCDSSQGIASHLLPRAWVDIGFGMLGGSHGSYRETRLPVSNGIVLRIETFRSAPVYLMVDAALSPSGHHYVKFNFTPIVGPDEGDLKMTAIPIRGEYSPTYKNLTISAFGILYEGTTDESEAIQAFARIAVDLLGARIQSSAHAGLSLPTAEAMVGIRARLADQFSVMARVGAEGSSVILMSTDVRDGYGLGIDGAILAELKAEIWSWFELYARLTASANLINSHHSGKAEHFVGSAGIGFRF